jgi:hypothetical protein
MMPHFWWLSQRLANDRRSGDYFFILHLTDLHHSCGASRPQERLAAQASINHVHTSILVASFEP